MSSSIRAHLCVFIFVSEQTFHVSVLKTSHFALARLGHVHTELLTVKGHELPLLRHIIFYFEVVTGSPSQESCGRKVDGY